MPPLLARQSSREEGVLSWEESMVGVERVQRVSGGQRSRGEKRQAEAELCCGRHGAEWSFARRMQGRMVDGSITKSGREGGLYILLQAYTTANTPAPYPTSHTPLPIPSTQGPPTKPLQTHTT